VLVNYGVVPVWDFLEKTLEMDENLLATRVLLGLLIHLLKGLNHEGAHDVAQLGCVFFLGLHHDVN
jgi:hypothetical protein